jgi:hypothetical protein
MLEGSRSISPPLLVAGAPRTGTTWIANVLSRAEGVTWINEPDNEWPNLFALRAKRSLGRFPALREGDSAPDDYWELWRRALAGGRQGRYREALAWKLDGGARTMQELWRAMCDHAAPRLSWRLRLLSLLAAPPSTGGEPGRVLVKTVHAPLALEWIGARFQPRVLLVERHPLNVVASWTELGWGGCALDTNPTVRARFGARWKLPQLGPDPTPLDRVAWEVGLFTSALHAAADRHPDWPVASHDALCLDPEAGFRRLHERLGLSWRPETSAYLEESNRPGMGWSMSRVAADQPESWKKRLQPGQIRAVWSVLSRFDAPWVARLARDVG